MLKFVVACTLLGMALAATTVPPPTHCTSDSDCGADECCTAPLIGKRFIFDDIFNHHSTCKSLAQEGHHCEPDLFNHGASHSHALGCPCAKGLECHGDKETHQDGSHYFANPRCIAEGTYTGATQAPTVAAPTVA